MSEHTKEPFWAGGSPPGWFVKFYDVGIIWFDSHDFADGEKGACKQANAVAIKLNKALEAN